MLSDVTPGRFLDHIDMVPEIWYKEWQKKSTLPSNEFIKEKTAYLGDFTVAGDPAIATNKPNLCDCNQQFAGRIQSVMSTSTYRVKWLELLEK
ncbi:hypothetical protein Btru_016458 [Bulinus truncatus]|nr:hypothetical protein Btru_016458 [Bulinus truncatus]